MCHLNKTATIKNIVLILKNSNLLSKFYNPIIQAEQPLLQQISSLLSSVCTTENDDKVIIGGLATYDELALYFKSEKTICALTQLFLCMKKYELLDDKNIKKILK
ncbi:MAG: hypothetical protein SFW66_05625, partial [Gammaproteobacteria bacterium]|nr:hypothetical protein [Gammaproteobacteria bacterium]